MVASAGLRTLMKLSRSYTDHAGARLLLHTRRREAEAAVEQTTHRSTNREWVTAKPADVIHWPKIPGPLLTGFGRGSTRTVGEIELLISDFKLLPEQFSTEAGTLAGECARVASGLRATSDQLGEEFMAFKAQHGLTRTPEVRATPLVNAAFICAIVSVESILNALNFAPASEAGVAGGLYIAGAISLVNALTASLLAAPGMRAAHHRSAGQKLLGGALIGAALSLAFCVNLFAGHFRAACERDPLGASAAAWQGFTSAPLNIPSANAWLLTILGLMAVLSIALKLFSSDDPYPRFGASFRRWKRAENERDAHLRASQRELRKAFAESDARGKQLLRKINASLSVLENAAARAASGARGRIGNSGASGAKADFGDLRRLKMAVRRIWEHEACDVQRELIEICRVALSRLETQTPAAEGDRRALATEWWRQSCEVGQPTVNSVSPTSRQ